MKLTTGILAVVMMTGAAWGQNPGAIDNTRSDREIAAADKDQQPTQCWWRKRPSQHRALRRRR